MASATFSRFEAFVQAFRDSWSAQSLEPQWAASLIRSEGQEGPWRAAGVRFSFACASAGAPRRHRPSPSGLIHLHYFFQRSLLFLFLFSFFFFEFRVDTLTISHPTRRLQPCDEFSRPLALPVAALPVAGWWPNGVVGPVVRLLADSQRFLIFSSTILPLWVPSPGLSELGLVAPFMSFASR